MSQNQPSIDVVKDLGPGSQIVGLEPQQVFARNFLVAKVGMTELEALNLVMEIGSARSAELTDVLKECAGTVAEVVAKLIMWMPRRPH
jgi:hypothetical protein